MNRLVTPENDNDNNNDNNNNNNNNFVALCTSKGGPGVGRVCRNTANLSRRHFTQEPPQGAHFLALT